MSRRTLSLGRHSQCDRCKNVSACRNGVRQAGILSRILTFDHYTHWVGVGCLSELELIVGGRLAPSSALK